MLLMLERAVGLATGILPLVPIPVPVFGGPQIEIPMELLFNKNGAQECITACDYYGPYDFAGIKGDLCGESTWYCHNALSDADIW